MKTFLSAVLAAFFVCGSASAGDLVLSPTPYVAQQTVYYGGPVGVPTTTYYAPTAGYAQSYYAPSYYAPRVTSYYAPTAVAAPVTAYYAPAPVAVAPVTAYYPPRVTTYYAPTAVAAPVTAYYAPAPVAVPMTTYYAPAAVVRSKVYYPGEPVRNFFRAITP